MQPKEVFIIDITKPEEELLAGMKQKTRYNIKIAQKHRVFINVIPAQAGIQEGSLDSGSEAGMTNKYIDEFLRLVKITAERDGITPHPESYYRKMFETIPGEILKLYVAEYQGKIIAANIVIHYGNTATYLHGVSANEARNVMAPYLLQWQGIKDAKGAGLIKYDMGGVKISNPKSEIQNPNIHNTKYIIHDTKSWQGITRFKTGFSPGTKPTEFPGSYDVIINSNKYKVYKIISTLRNCF